MFTIQNWQWATKDWNFTDHKMKLNHMHAKNSGKLMKINENDKPKNKDEKITCFQPKWVLYNQPGAQVDYHI